MKMQLFLTIITIGAMMAYLFSYRSFLFDLWFFSGCGIPDDPISEPKRLGNLASACCPGKIYRITKEEYG